MLNIACYSSQLILHGSNWWVQINYSLQNAEGYQGAPGLILNQYTLRSYISLKSIYIIFYVYADVLADYKPDY